MRPVNLIPPDERRGDSAPLRTGHLIYVLLGGLALLLLGIVVVALTSKQISDRQAEKAALEVELQQETARANSLAAFANFRAVQQQRTATVTSLAQSRFDWQRVLNELALVLPSNVSVSNLTGTVSPDVTIESSGSSGASSGTDLRGEIAGPALDISGCAPGQDAVAGFVSALEDIDGVTRVGLDSSEISTEDSGETDSSGCFAGPNTAKFHIVVAFDEVPTPSTATEAPSVPSSLSSSPPADASQVAEGQAQQAQARESTNAQVSEAKNAKSTLMPGG
jgi:Tfp pilus assembly protein PilN